MREDDSCSRRCELENLSYQNTLLGLCAAVYTDRKMYSVFRSVEFHVPAVVFSIAEQPRRNTAVVRGRWALLPTGCTILVSALMRRLVRVVAAVVVEVTIPKLRDTFAIVA